MATDNKTCTYTLAVSNAADTPATATATGALTIAPFVISSQPVNTTASVGGSVTFSVTASVSQGVPGYQWQKDGVNIAGKTARTLTFNPVAAADAGLYAVVVTNTVSGPTVSVTSTTASLNVAPVIGTQPVNAAAAVGGSATFTAVASVSRGVLSYQWQKGGVDIVGQTGASLTFNPVAAGDAGLYSVNVISTFNGTPATTPSGNASLNVAPVINTQPINTTASVGGSANFTVVATSSQGTLSYQWQKGGVNLAGMTAATLNINPVAASDTALYQVVVTNTFNGTFSTTTSSLVSLNVAPVITSQPTNQTALVGGSASFTVVATGSQGTLSYQWQKGGVNLAGKTTATLTLNPVAASDTALYQVVVTNTFNGTASTTTSSSVSLNVAPVITTQPTNQTASVGGSASFAVVATVSSGTLSYQWQKGGVDIGGQTGASLTFNPVAASDTALYQVVVTNTFNSTTSTTTSSQVSLNVAPVITTQPTNQIASVGGSASFSVVATVSSGTLSHQWQKGGVDIGGQTGTSLTFNPVAAGDAGLYSVNVTSSLNGTTATTPSGNASLNVAPVINTQPINTTASVGGSASFTVVATSSQGTLSYQWQKGGVNLAGKTAATLNINPVAASDTGLYQVVVTNTFSSTTTTTTSSQVSLNVAPVITTQPTNQTASVGGSATFTVVATISSGALSYQWQKGGVDIVGQTGPSLAFNPVAASDAGLYAVVATSTFNGTTISTSSNIVSLNVAPVITSQPANQTASVGAFASFSVAATVSSGTLSYQWQKGGVDIGGQTSSSLTFSTVAASDAGLYAVMVTSTFNGTTISTTSNIASLNVAPVITAQPANQTASVGGSASFTVAATVSAGTLSYQWKKAAANIAGKTSATLTFNPVAASDAAMYSVVVTSTLNSTTISTTSSSVSLNVAPVITTQPFSQIAAQGALASFSVVANVSSGTLSYQWQKNGANLADGGNVSGATTATLSLASVGLSNVALYRVVVTSNFNATTSSTTSNSVALTVNNALNSGIQRVGGTATLLPNGKVLIAGGGRQSSSGTCTLVPVNSRTVEIFDPVTGVSTQLGGATPLPNQMMSIERCQHAAVLAGTSVYFFGGANTTNVDVFDTTNNTFLIVLLPTVATVRLLPTATLLGAASGVNNGKIVIAGGYNAGVTTTLNSIELFTPSGSTSSSTTYTAQLGGGTAGGTGRGDHTATLVGKWLFFIGGRYGAFAGVSSSVDAIDTTLAPTGGGAATIVNSTPSANATARRGHSAVALNSGNAILLMGGLDFSLALLNAVQTYAINPTTGSASGTATPNINMASARAYFPVLQTLTADKFLVFGGTSLIGNPDQGSTSIELIDATVSPITASPFQGGVVLSVARQESTAVLISNGGNPAFLVAGGDPGGAAANGTHEVIVDP
jgi:hypothetical protein